MTRVKVCSGEEGLAEFPPHTGMLCSESYTVRINIANQRLSLYQSDQLTQEPIELAEYQVSTAKNGIGSLEGSGCTPLGRHRIEQKIGADMPVNTVFVGRVATGEIYDETLKQQHPHRDWILSRILWLAGCEEGHNKGQNDQGVCDTYQRYIYIHGTPDSEPMGVPLSHGCVRMRNQDIIELFDRVTVGTVVDIVNEPSR